jgi:hypothetical protein
VTSSAGDRPFSVNGDTFVNIGAALQRSCSVSGSLFQANMARFGSNPSQVQNNACSDDANSGKLSGGVGQCQTQEDACNAAGGS